MTLWREVLTALNSPHTAGREHVLARGAAALARSRARPGGPAAEDVRRIALEEFGVLLDPLVAQAALESR
ncbi:hypothetical protein ACFWXK_21440 [Streptomyces sp. NPDC059070]|uniref:hypothetical protein n=1 Tax=Streptomyces sp. NPDC059070 TaxID=3346713 RepID=UPI00369A995E